MSHQPMYTDSALLAVIKQQEGLDQAIRFIYEQYADMISAFIMKNNGTYQDAEDIFQETVVAFIEVVRSDKFRGESTIKTFLVSIARNRWMNELNKRERTGYREQVFENVRDDKESDISSLIADREIQQQFREVLGRLGEHCKKILMLFYYENLSMKEIVAHVPYENEQVVRNKKYKCLQQLTGLLRDNPALTRLITSRNG